MSKSDKVLQEDIINELAWDPSVNATRVGVAVKDGVVTLTGHLDTFAEKEAAIRALRRVSGVKAIAVEIDVKLSGEHKRTDTDIANSVEVVLKWHTSIPPGAIRPDGRARLGDPRRRGRVGLPAAQRREARSVRSSAWSASPTRSSCEPKPWPPTFRGRSKTP